MLRPTLGALLTLFAIGGAAAAPSDCPRQLLRPPPGPAELTAILDDHKAWIASHEELPRLGRRADLKYRNLTRVDLSGVDLSQAEVTGARLHGAQLEGTNISQADLVCTELLDADLKDADMFLANLSNARLVGTNFTPAKDVSGMILVGADLTNADLTGKDLSRVDFSGAKLVNTTLAHANLAGAMLRGTIWQPRDMPTVESLDCAKPVDCAQHLKTLTVDRASPSIGGLEQLKKALRDAGRESLAKQVAYAQERAQMAMDFRTWQRDGSLVALATALLRWFAGQLTDFGQSIFRGGLVILTFALFFLPVYYRWGFNPSAYRKVGIVRVIPARTVVSTGAGTTLTRDETIELLAPWSRFRRLMWAAGFTGITTVRSGIGSLNVLKAVEATIGWSRMEATGFLWWVATGQALVSLLLIGCVVYGSLI